MNTTLSHTLSDKMFSVTFPCFFRIRIPICSQRYMNCSYISKKIWKFFHGFIFGNLKITKIKKIILATINLPKGEWFVPKCKTTLKKFPSYIESFIFCIFVVGCFGSLWVVVARCGLLHSLVQPIVLFLFLSFLFFI